MHGFTLLVILTFVSHQILCYYFAVIRKRNEGLHQVYFYFANISKQHFIHSLK